MAHIYKASEWESANAGIWYVNDTSDLCGIAGKWWVPMRILKLTPEEYVKLLRDTYKATGFKYCRETDCLTFHFTSLADARKWKNFINAAARKRGIMV